MSAPFIIPFNHQPNNTFATTSTYVVPSGKYARVNFGSGKTVSVNATPLFLTVTTSLNTPTANANTVSLAFPSDASTMTINFGASYGTAYVTFSDVSDPSTSNYQFTASGGTQFSLPIGTYRSGTSVRLRTNTNVTVSTVTIFIEPEDKVIWLKSGDTISFAGSIFVEEYNTIS